MPKTTKLTIDNITLENIGKHWIEVSDPTSSGDTLSFNNPWTRDNSAYYVNTGNANLPLNKDILSGEPYGKDKVGFDHVYAEIDAFKLDDKGNLVPDVFPDERIALKNALSVKDPKRKEDLLKMAQLHQLPVAYITDNYVASKDAQGKTTYSVSKVRPYMVVYRAHADVYNPYQGTPAWYRDSIIGNDSHSEAVALMDCMVDYMRGVQFVNYDFYAPNSEDVVGLLTDETGNNVTPAENNVDGVLVDNVRAALLRQNGVMSTDDISDSGEPEVRGVESENDPQVQVVDDEEPKNTQYIDMNMGKGPLGIEQGVQASAPKASGNGSQPKPTNNAPKSAPKSTPKSAPKSTPKASAPKTSSTKNSTKSGSKSTSKKSSK